VRRISVRAKAAATAATVAALVVVEPAASGGAGTVLAAYDADASYGGAGPGGTVGDPASAYATTTPIKHLVVIFDENVSFDHYFGTYPDALNPPGEPPFHALPGTAITLSGRTTGRPPPVP
jgi:phospholipase C